MSILLALRTISPSIRWSSRYLASVSFPVSNVMIDSHTTFVVGYNRFVRSVDVRLALEPWRRGPRSLY